MLSYTLYLTALILELSLLAIATDLLGGHAGRVGVSAIFFAGWGGYAYGLFTTRLSINPGVSVLLTLGLTTAFGFIASFLFARLKGYEFLLASFGLLIAFVDLTKNLDLAGGPLGVRNIPFPTLGGYLDDPTIAGVSLLSFSLAGVLAFSLFVLRDYMPWSLRLHAIRDDEISSTSLGISTAKIIRHTFVVHSLIASLAGVGSTIVQSYIGPDSFGLTLGLSVFAVVYLGGTGGNPLFLVLSSSLLILLTELIARWITEPEQVGSFEQILFNAGLIVVLIVRRRGIGGPPIEEGPQGSLED